MKIIISKKYSEEKLSQIVDQQQPRISRQEWHDKLQKVIEQVSKGVDPHQAISQEFRGLSQEGIEKMKYFVQGALGQEVSMA